MSSYLPLSPVASPAQLAASEILTRRSARHRFADYLTVSNPRYDRQWFHEVIADRLQQLHERHIRKLMIFMPPQHGKSSASTRTFPAWVLGKHPDTKICVTSYSSTIAGRFNRDIKRGMETDRYRALFPDTRLGDGRNGYLNNNDIVEVEGKEGFIYTVGVGGSLTSVSVDLGIIDDPIKDRQAAQSPTLRESIWDWYTDVFETRLHNDSVQVLIQTRWHQDDLAGRLLNRDGIYSADNETGWVVINFPALRTDDINDFDPRPVGAALWPEKHSQAKIEKIAKEDSVKFTSLYQGDPKPSKESLVFPNWHECDEFPANCELIFYVHDFGYTNDPSATVAVGKLGRRLYLDEKLYETGLTNLDIAKRWVALGIPHNADIIGDSAEPKSIKELQTGFVDFNTNQRIRGFAIRPSVKGPDSISAGISKLHEFEVYVTKRSRNIIKEKNNYQYIMMGDVATNEPIDAYNHAIDAVRGGVYTKYGKPQLITTLKNRQR
ncbi:hypothetical protein GGR92_005259 [Spirosoma lacussanchae]|uniref:terminase large subunit n=1 Tax=Spirosoma lacussanchae TaxID=1884249 RepID=UPI00110990C4|nr:terminase large subunit [Spirosoma lacussanchae]